MLLLLVVLLCTVQAAYTEVWKGRTLTFFPTDDTYTWAQKRTTNFGQEDILVVKHDRARGPNFRHIFLKFDLRGQCANVASAELVLHVTRPPESSIEQECALVMDNNWSERTITFDNEPPTSLVERPCDQITKKLKEEDSVAFNVTTPVAKALMDPVPLHHILTFRVYSTTVGSKALVSYHSKEARRKQPQLIVKCHSLYECPHSTYIPAPWYVILGSILVVLFVVFLVVFAAYKRLAIEEEPVHYRPRLSRRDPRPDERQTLL